jgi:hypothetical protein
MPLGAGRCVADQVRGRFPGTGGMHYVNGTSTLPVCSQMPTDELAKEDYPADKCSFGEHGWVDEGINVLTAIMNMTDLIQTGRGSKQVDSQRASSE